MWKGKTSNQPKQNKTKQRKKNTMAKSQSTKATSVINEIKKELTADQKKVVDASVKRYQKGVDDFTSAVLAAAKSMREVISNEAQALKDAGISEPVVKKLLRSFESKCMSRDTINRGLKDIYGAERNRGANKNNKDQTDALVRMATSIIQQAVGAKKKSKTVDPRKFLVSALKAVDDQDAAWECFEEVYPEAGEWFASE